KGKAIFIELLTTLLTYYHSSIMALTTGTKAPEFSLKYKHANGLDDVSLADNFGKKKTVLLFFPLAFTSVCMEEMCSVNSGIEKYKDLNAAVYGISVDSPFALEKMALVDNLQFPLLSDFNKEVSAAYDVLFEDLLGFKGVSKRSAFVIDENGVIVYAESSDDPKQLPNFEAIQAALV
ncbi:MAG: redoxin domain-containing protein, partial [Opitutales bacterium]